MFSQAAQDYDSFVELTPQDKRRYTNKAFYFGLVEKENLTTEQWFIQIQQANKKYSRVDLPPQLIERCNSKLDDIN